MLYEVITKKWKISKKMRRAAPRSLLWNITIEATVDRNYINNVYHQMMGRNVGIKVEESLFVILDVITSYSIHYTKLYD